MITLLDYGAGNVRSVRNAIKQLGFEVRDAVNADDKKRARLNCISHLLSLIEYEDLSPEPIELPPRQVDPGYQRPPITSQKWVPAVYGKNFYEEN